MTDERDPATDPHMDIRRFPQDPAARQPGERLRAFRARVGNPEAPAPYQDGDELDEP